MKKIHSLNIPQTSGATLEEESLPCFCSRELGRFSDDFYANELLCFDSLKEKNFRSVNFSY